MTRRPLHSRPGRAIPDRPGVPAERTELTWERSGLGMLAAAGLLLFRHVEPLTPSRAVLVALYLVLATATVQIGRRRGRQVRGIHACRSGAPVPAAPAAVALLAGATLLIATATAVVVLLDA
ncbi:MAG: DUF202 domain-containing protein [Actinomycetes bacterium]